MPTASGASRRPRVLLPLLLLAYAGWAFAFIRASSFVIDGQRHFALFDDAMVSMRYARNVARGDGLVWNAGDAPVEGITNLLWTLYMAALHALPLPPALASLPLQLTGVAALGAVLVLVWRRAAARLSTAAAVAATAWTAFYLPLNTWSLLGTEVGVLTLLVVAATLGLARAFEAGRFAWWPYVLFGVAVLVRLDAAVFLAAAAAVIAPADPRHRRQHLAWALGSLAVAAGSQTAFRLWYYGEWLPNTYYLKMTGYPAGARIARGAAVFARFVATSNFVVFVAAAAAVVMRPVVATRLFAAQVAAACAYSIYVGGDAWEWWGGANRFVAPAMPLLFLLAAEALEAVRLGLRQPSGREGVANAVVAVLIAGVLVNVNLRVGWRSLAELALLEKPLLTRGVEQMVRHARRLEPIVAPDARVAVVWAGALPYFLDRPAIDLLGKSDPVIARQPAVYQPRSAADLVEFYPGHMKWDDAYAIGRLAPDVVVDVWEPETRAQYLAGRYLRWRDGDLTVWLRADSPRIDWSAVRRSGELEAEDGT